MFRNGNTTPTYHNSYPQITQIIIGLHNLWMALFSCNHLQQSDFHAKLRKFS
jgi:hypothetical protein